MKDSFFQYHHSKIVWCLIMMREHFFRVMCVYKSFKVRFIEDQLEITKKMFLHTSRLTLRHDISRTFFARQKKWKRNFFFPKWKLVMLFKGLLSVDLSFTRKDCISIFCYKLPFFLFLLNTHTQSQNFLSFCFILRLLLSSFFLSFCSSLY